MKSQPIKKPEAKKQPIVVDQRKPKPGHLVRTINYVEVGDMTPEQITSLAIMFAKQYEGNVYGPHYFLPARNGHLSTDIQFENEILSVVNQLCEVRDGKIVLKGEPVKVQVIRNFVDNADTA